MNRELVAFERDFPWESEDQKQGFLNLVQYLRSLPPEGPEIPGPPFFTTRSIACYFIQKDHESMEWLLDHIARQTDPLQKRVDALEVQVSELKGAVAALVVRR